MAAVPYPPLNLPEAPLKLARRGRQVMVWDGLRGKYLVLTPEEWVRQHWVHFLQIYRQVPRGSLALETGLEKATRQQRTDLLVYKKQQPYLLLECKAPQVKLSQATMDQAARYQRSLQCRLILLSNGQDHWLARPVPGGLEWLPELPPFDQWAMPPER